MLITAHGAIAVTAYWAAAKTIVPGLPLDAPILFLVFTAGILPDLPITLLMLTGTFDPLRHRHHRWIFHQPWFWIVCGSVVAMLGLPRTGMAVTVFPLLHLAFDWFGAGDGIPFLAPFSLRQFGVDLSGVHGPPAQRYYLSRTRYLGMEAAAHVALILIVLFGKR
ncbi:metal-dependent hydrolase [bacterium]|nr:metal-dependent hydrolase [candidate division CSSED10-310 bacterium]